MYNAYGERHLCFMRVPVATLDSESRTSAQTPARTITQGIPADAALVSVVLAQPTSDDRAVAHEVRLVYEHESFPLVLAGDQIGEATITAEVTTTTVATATVQEG